MGTATAEKNTQVRVSESLAGLNVRVDREKGVVPGVKILGLESRNGRFYPPDVQRRAVTLYEGAKVNIDHPTTGDMNTPRGVADRFGVLRNVRFVEGSGLHADLHYNPEHQLANQVAWEVENNPSNIGFSHNAMIRKGRRQGSRVYVEAIDAVKSVDLVADPATTNGIFESIETQEKTMDLKELTLDQLKEERPDLIEALMPKKTETETGEESSEVEKLRGELKAALAKIDSMQSAESIRGELEAVGFDPTNKHADKRLHVSDAFLNVLQACESAEQRKALIDDRWSLVGEAETEQKTKTKPSGGKPTTTPATETVEGLTGEDWLKRVRRRT